MLVLSRKVGEKIAIDGDVVLEVLEVSGNRVRIGIAAPETRRIMRAERLHDHRPLDESANRQHLLKAPLTRAGA